ncbi:hypothetical protein HZS_3354 [Henneguya salminicola]|nr:hypothetical protein HZS_3354 [Henneguya salminicola]
MESLLIKLPSYPCLKKKMDGPRLNAICGDGTLDAGEECDCGFDGITFYKYIKSFALIIQKLENVVIKTYANFEDLNINVPLGRVVETVLTKNNICRSAVNECDIPEICDGISPTCKKDTKSPDYRLCQNGQGYCYRGNCIDHNYTCKISYKSGFRNTEEIWQNWYCYYGECITDKSLKNCRNGACQDMNKPINLSINWESLDELYGVNDEKYLGSFGPLSGNKDNELILRNNLPRNLK